MLKFLRTALLLALAMTQLSCNNNLSGQAVVPSGSSSTPSSGTPSASGLVISRILFDDLNPGTFLNVIGNGSGAFDIFCGGAGANPNAPAVCNCIYSYNSKSQPSGPIPTPVTYAEANLLQCRYSQIPSDVSTVTVSVQVVASSSVSNSLAFNLTSNPNVLDLTNPNSYAQVIRYQCRQFVDGINYLYFPSVYDPVQGEDAHLSYGLDFYSTNLGDTIAAFLQEFSNNQGGLFTFECPPVLDLSSLTTTPRLNYANSHQLALALYGKAADPTQPLDPNYFIFDPSADPSTVQPRSTFYLAKAASGPFRVPVNAYVAPATTTTNDAPLGFGVSPVAGSGPGQETCPTAGINIAPGFRWVKVWLFRAGLPSRQAAIPDPTKANNIANIQSALCNPGDWNPTTPIWPGCPLSMTDATTSATTVTVNGITFRKNVSIAYSEVSPLHPLADRVLGTGQCIRLDDNKATNTKAVFCGGHPGPGCEASSGADDWLTHFISPTSGIQTGCTAQPFPFDPTATCSINDPPAQPPTNSNVAAQSLDNQDPRFDFVFVVSPITITTNDMTNTSISSNGIPYQPYRFFTPEDCAAPNPDSPGGSGTLCLASNAINNYGVLLQDVNTSPGSNTNTPPAFPVCALQPIP